MLIVLGNSRAEKQKSILQHLGLYINIFENYGEAKTLLHYFYQIAKVKGGKTRLSIIVFLCFQARAQE